MVGHRNLRVVPHRHLHAQPRSLRRLPRRERLGDVVERETREIYQQTGHSVLNRESVLVNGEDMGAIYGSPGGAGVVSGTTAAFSTTAALFCAQNEAAAGSKIHAELQYLRLTVIGADT